MIDIKNIREQQSLIQDRLTKRDKSISLDSIEYNWPWKNANNRHKRPNLSTEKIKRNWYLNKLITYKLGCDRIGNK